MTMAQNTRYGGSELLYEVLSKVRYDARKIVGVAISLRMSFPSGLVVGLNDWSRLFPAREYWRYRVMLSANSNRSVRPNA